MQGNYWRSRIAGRGPACISKPLPPGRILNSEHDFSMILDFDTFFIPDCNEYGNTFTPLVNKLHHSNEFEPFYASIVSISLALGGMIVFSWILNLLLLLTTGKRPWLQSISALLVAIYVSIAVGQIVNILRNQYYQGFYSAAALRLKLVTNNSQIILRIVCFTLNWFAQVQTLLRLFPRRVEKFLINWIGLSLIIVDTVLASLQEFIPPADSSNSFIDALPALSYLFQTVLAFLYAIVIIQYAIIKSPYAFSKSQYQFGIFAILTSLLPIILFILDIAEPLICFWGDYIRLVSSVSATVIVWEWVERIEREENSHLSSSFLGRKIYDQNEDENGNGKGHPRNHQKDFPKNNPRNYLKTHPKYYPKNLIDYSKYYLKNYKKSYLENYLRLYPNNYGLKNYPKRLLNNQMDKYDNNSLYDEESVRYSHQNYNPSTQFFDYNDACGYQNHNHINQYNNDNQNICNDQHQSNQDLCYEQTEYNQNLFYNQTEDDQNLFYNQTEDDQKLLYNQSQSQNRGESNNRKKLYNNNNQIYLKKKPFSFEKYTGFLTKSISNFNNYSRSFWRKEPSKDNSELKDYTNRNFLNNIKSINNSESTNKIPSQLDDSIDDIHNDLYYIESGGGINTPNFPVLNNLSQNSNSSESFSNDNNNTHYISDHTMPRKSSASEISRSYSNQVSTFLTDDCTSIHSTHSLCSNRSIISHQSSHSNNSHQSFHSSNSQHSIYCDRSNHFYLSNHSIHSNHTNNSNHSNHSNIPTHSTHTSLAHYQSSFESQLVQPDNASNIQSLIDNPCDVNKNKDDSSYKSKLFLSERTIEKKRHEYPIKRNNNKFSVNQSQSEIAGTIPNLVDSSKIQSILKTPNTASIESSNENAPLSSNNLSVAFYEPGGSKVSTYNDLHTGNIISNSKNENSDGYLLHSSLNLGTPFAEPDFFINPQQENSEKIKENLHDNFKSFESSFHPDLKNDSCLYSSNNDIYDCEKNMLKSIVDESSLEHKNFTNSGGFNTEQEFTLNDCSDKKKKGRD